MNDTAALSDLFPASAQAALRAAGIELEATLAALLAVGRAAWPGVELPPAAFVAQLVRHLPPEPELPQWLKSVQAEDLYLACACALGEPAALAEFERTILSQVPRFISRNIRSPSDVDEVQQLVRQRLLCAPAGMAPRIAEYAGTGALASFVRVTAVRTALNLLESRAGKKAQDLDEDAMSALPAGRDPELSLIRTRYQTDFHQALRDAFATLSSDQRNVLRLRFAVGLTIEQAAAVLKVNRATVVRWQAAAEKAMLKETQRLLRQRLRVSPAELDSLIRLVRSEFQLSLSDVLPRSASE